LINLKVSALIRNTNSKSVNGDYSINYLRSSGRQIRHWIGTTSLWTIFVRL